MRFRLFAMAFAVVLAVSGVLAQEGAATGHTIRVGQSVSGSLAPGDFRLQTGEYQDTYKFKAAEGQEVTISLTSSDFDPYLILIHPNGTHSENDDFKGSDALLSLKLTETGNYKILVTSYKPGETGTYTLTVSEGLTPGAPSGKTKPFKPIKPDQTVKGALESDDSQISSGEYFDGYVFQGAKDQEITIGLDSSDFDAYLILKKPDGTQLENDDYKDNNALLSLKLAEPGEYRILATSYKPGETGAYTLSLRSGMVANPPKRPVAGENIEIGQAVKGTLAQGDKKLSTGEYRDVYYFTTTSPNQRVTITLNSTEFDPYLIFICEDGTKQENDDFQGSSQISQLTPTIASPGEHQVTVTSYSAGETGDYTLTLSLGPETKE